MKKTILLLVYIVTSTVCFGQKELSDALNALGTPNWSINQKNTDVYDSDIGKFVSKPIKKNKYLKSYTLYFDELDELTLIDFKLIGNYNLKKQTDEIAKLLTSIGYEDVGLEKDILGNTLKIMQNNGVVAKIDIAGDFSVLGPSISFSLASNEKILSKYDEFDKETVLKVINSMERVESENKLNYSISFAGLLEKKILYLRIKSTDTDWKFINSVSILLDNGEVIDLDLVTSRNVQKTLGVIAASESTLTPLNKDISEKFLRSNIVKMKIKGSKSTGVIILNKSHINSLKLIYNKLYM